MTDVRRTKDSTGGGRLQKLGQDDKAVILILTALLFPVLLAFMGLALDVGMIYDYKRRQQEALEQRLREADVVITTALIPGRPAPRLISAAMVEMMPAGSVLVDLAADQGGNCELTTPGEIVQQHGVTIVGIQNVASLVPVHATDMYAKNVQHLLLHLTKEGEWNLDPEDEITSGSALTKGGEIVHEPTAETLKAGSDQG